MSRAAVGAALLFLLLGAAIVAGWTGAFDRAVLATLRVAGRPGTADVPGALVAAARRLTVAGTIAVRGPLLLVAMLWLGRRGRGRTAVVLAGAVAVGELLVQGIKALVGRPRPPIAWALAHAGSTSLPSGHAAGSMVLYPLLGWLVARALARRGAGWAAAGVALALLIGATRVLLGVHWASDVAAGWLLGAAVARAGARIAQGSSARRRPPMARRIGSSPA